MANFPTCEPKPLPKVEPLTEAENARFAQLQEMAWHWSKYTFTAADQAELNALDAKMQAAEDYQGYRSRLRRWKEAGHPATRYNHPE